jgi:hypothetical protein
MLQTPLMATMIMEMPMGSLMAKSMRRSPRMKRKAGSPKTPMTRERKARNLKIPTVKRRRRMQTLPTPPMMKERTTQAMLRISRRPLPTRREESRRRSRVTKA